MNEVYQQLRQRPDIGQAVARYEEMLSKLYERLAADFPAMGWQRSKDRAGASACGFDFPGLNTADGEKRGLEAWEAKGNLPDPEWKRALVPVGEIAKGYGFEGPATIVDRPGDHKVIFKDGYAAELSFGTAVNTLLTLDTGCHLTAEAHRRGTPAATSTP
ncbi:hypothetical protein GCM10010452_84870 [Crossiella cryophila]